MNPAHERFAELATRALEASPELRDEACSELMSRFSHFGAKDDEIEFALCRLEKAGSAGRGWKGIFTGGFVLLALAVATFLQVRSVWPELELIPVAIGETIDQGAWVDRLTEDERELFGVEFNSRPLGGTAITTNDVVSSTDALRLRYPDDPALQELHALYHIARKSDVPASYRERWQRIDPDNGIWNAWEAAAITWSGTRGRRPPDQLKSDLRDALDLLEQAVASPRFHSHVPDLRRRQAALIPEFPPTFIGEAARLRLSTVLNRIHPAGSLESSALAAL